MSEIAQAVGDAAKKAEQGLAQDFSKAYHSILKETEEKTTQVAEHAAENEAKTVEDLGKSAEHAGVTPHDPHAPSGGPSAHPAEGGAPVRGAGREQVQDPHDAGRGDDAVCGGGEPVDMATGRMYIDQVDAALPGSLPLLFTRAYESGYRAGRWMGRRWVCTFDERLEIDAEGVVHLRADRVSQAYPHPEPGEPVHASAGDRRLLGVDARARLYTVTEPRTGLVREFTVQADGATALLTRVRDRSGRRYDLEYDGAGTPLAIQHSGGYRLLVTTDRDRITALHLAGAAPDGGDQELLRYGYGEHGNLTEVYNSSGLPMRFGYDAWDRVTSWTDRNDSRYRYVYDSRGRVVDEGGEDGHLRFTFHYGEPDPATGLRVHTETNALGHTTQYHVNDRHQVVAVVDPLGNTTRYVRDRFDRLLSETDPLGRTTGYAYDGAGGLVTVTRPDGGRREFDYAGELDRPALITEPDGSAWRQTFDDAGLCTSVTDPAGAVTAYTYDEHGHPLSKTDALGHTWSVRCNAAGLAVETTDPTGVVTRYERDAFGRVVTATDARSGVIRQEWTVEGRLTARTAADGTVERWTYDGEGNRLTHTDQLGRITGFEYTHFETLAARTDPDGARFEFRHDAHMQLVSVHNPLGQSWTYSYDAAGRVVQERDFDGRATDYVLDAAGQLGSHTDSLGLTTRYEHDVLGRTVRRRSGDRVTDFAYDDAGRLVRAANHESELLRTYDPVGRLLSETCDGHTLTLTRDPLGRRTSRTTPGGHTSTLVYDPAGRLTNLRAGAGSLAFDYDELGREQHRELGHGLGLTSVWDECHRLTGQSVEAARAGRENAVLQRRAYHYAPDGRVAELDDLRAGSRRFARDTAGRVVSVRADNWAEHYAYDLAGNITDADWPTSRGTADSDGPRVYSGTDLLTGGKIRYEYDAAGRTVLRQRARLSRKPDTWRFRWDTENRLVEAHTPDGSRWRYRYDPLGRRIAKQRLAEDGSTVAEETRFTWDGALLVEQSTEAPYLPGRHTVSWDHKGIRPVSQSESIVAAAREGASAQDRVDRRFFAIVTDLIGTPVELVDPASGTIAWRGNSALWGHTTWQRDSSTTTPLRFPGQYFDAETLLHYNLYRYYDPATARYTSPDPLGLGPSPNPRAYVADPQRWCDPLGLSPHGQEAKKGQLDPESQSGNLPLIADWIAAHGDINHRGIPGVDDLDVAEHIEDMMGAGPGIRLRDTPSGTKRWAWWDDSTGTILIREGDHGTFMQPTRGYDYYKDQLNE
ncbi:DUF6531 domain-containing protein [Streptacidiphilus neutrinimicus]|uniref:DUF6531 domain-containing protein n=1 Tax=Streptacidiphilus neutrinimicus TaxID=105420 RepID=UPI0006942B95|nr:DUF6531 domain-containing protein [Streptacidiphilus neutrinimicus]